jgi:nitrite reductase/ring-hydroxylating ferredoxin subunit
MTIELALDEIPDGGATIVKLDAKRTVALFRVGEKVTAIDNRCPHANAPLGMGKFDGTIVKCPLHGFTVDVWTGIGRAGKRVPCFPVRVADGKVLLEEEPISRP